MTARDVIRQVAQVLTTLLFAPLLQGVILQFEERGAARPTTWRLSALSRSLEIVPQADRRMEDRDVRPLWLSR